MYADVKGSVVGGKYLLLLQGNRYVPFGINESFDTVVGTVVTFFDQTSGTTGYTDNWEEGISGEWAFAGYAEETGTVTLTENTAVTAQGVIGGGVSGGAGEIVVTDIQTTGDARWWAGLSWPNQTLASTDVGLVSLTADIKGTANGGTIGDYMLRIEDANADWRAFHKTGDGSFQEVGGLLSDGAEGGLGDGLFDPTAGPFTVVVVFNNDAGNTWGTGGRLTVDNLYLTGGSIREVVGSVSFAGTVTDNTVFDTVGGVLSDGYSTFANVDEDFTDVSGTGGGTFFDSSSGSTGHTDGWDDGILDEEAFAGYWGDVAINGGASAEGLTAGGNDGGAGRIVVTDLDLGANPGGWWAGLMWPNQELPDLPDTEIYLWADVKGLAGTGGSYGQFHLRIEDADGDHLGMVETATFPPAFQTVGGPLSEFDEGNFPPNGDGTFHWDHGPFKVIVAFYNEAATWGSGGTLIVDNVSLTAPSFGAGADSFSAVVAFADEVDTWDTGGTLTVDNLRVLDSAAPIPTVSEWGLCAMVLLLLAAGTVVFRRCRAYARG
jgi:hypothetical protein